MKPVRPTTNRALKGMITARVTSVIGRFLEHSRVFYFRNGAANEIDGEFYIGSADWMHRNLEARVEVITPVDDASARRRLWEILQVQLGDQRHTCRAITTCGLNRCRRCHCRGRLSIFT